MSKVVLIDGDPGEIPFFEKQCLVSLEHAYPGYAWAVHQEGGVLAIKSMALSGCWGYRIMMKDFTLKSLIMAAGEILERYKMRRGQINADQYGAAARNHAGSMIADV